MPLAHLMGCILNPVSFRSEVYVTAWSACACPQWEESAEAQPLGDIRKSMWQSTKFSHFSEILCLCNCVQREKKAALWRLKQFSGVMIWRISCSVSWGCRKPARSLWMESMRCLINTSGKFGHTDWVWHQSGPNSVGRGMELSYGLCPHAPASAWGQIPPAPTLPPSPCTQLCCCLETSTSKQPSPFTTWHKVFKPLMSQVPNHWTFWPCSRLREFSQSNNRILGCEALVTLFWSRSYFMVLIGALASCVWLKVAFCFAAPF